MTPDAKRNTDALSGKTALVTGATAGIGFHTASTLASRGAVVYITGRDTNRGRDAERRMRATAGHDDIHFIRADASTVENNQQLADRVRAETDSLHVLVNNVGGFYNDRWETEDGYEATLAMNLVGPFALTSGLLPALQESTPARIVNVTSSAHTMWDGDPFADIHAEESYLGFEAYARSKLLNLLWTFALARRLEGSGVVANATNPGKAWTSQTANIAPRSMPIWQRLFWPLFRVIQRTGSPEKAARSSIFLASSPDVATVTGKYFESDMSEERPAAAIRDQATQEQTWELTESLVTNAPTAIRGAEEINN